LIAASATPTCGPPQTPAKLSDDSEQLEVNRLPSGLSGSTDVSIIVEPSDSGSALLTAINAAKKSVHMTMYLLTDTDLQNALIARHKAGVEVKVILNQHFPGGASSNAESFSTLETAGVQVVWAPSAFAYTHEKTLVIDGETAWIMTMNAATSSLTHNREYLAIDKTTADIKEAEAQFAADFAGKSYTPSGNLLMSPVTSRPGILALINSANVTLDFEDEELSDPEVTAAFCSAQTRGVRVRGVLSNETESSDEKMSVSQLKACGVSVVTVSTPYIHAKAIVADAAQIYVGSENFTAESLDKNRELGLITSTAAAVTSVATTVAADIAAGKPL
jgi:phosphatidylserine/phosphatidylglycerophosphate/cardiolipin synthase-like enzyme